MSRDTPDTLDLDALAAWVRSFIGQPRFHGDEKRRVAVMPSDLERELRFARNAAYGALEALEARGDLERIPGQALAWKLSPAPPQLAHGYSLSLSPAEHGALCRLLTWALQPEAAEHHPNHLDVPLLRSLRSRLLRKDNP